MASSGALPAGVRASPAAFDDIAEVDALFRRSDLALGVRPESRIEYLRWRWRLPWVDVARDTIMLRCGDDLIGYADQYHEVGPGPVAATARVDPGALGQGLGSWLAGWCEAAALGRGRPALRMYLPQADGQATALLVARGYVQVRSSLDMGIALTGDETAPEPPDGVRIRLFVPGEERTLWRVSSEAFRDHWDHVRDPTFEEFMADWFGDDLARALFAEADGEAVGELGWIRDGGDAYVISVGVLPAYRRRGIAGALLRTAIAEAARDGLVHLSLSVDAQSPTGAVGVYARAGLQLWRTMLVFDRELA